MQKGLKLDSTMRAVAMAIGAAIVTSVISMFVPVGVFETITGSTGISELIPATAAPLGDTARALIAFAFGIVAFAVTAALLLRKPAAARSVRPAAPSVEPVSEPAGEASIFEKMKARIAEFAASRRSDTVITELSDLPKLRAGDAHPDAPPRRPISANVDFAPFTPEAETPAAETAVAEGENTVDVANVASMVDRLETAVSAREEQLAKLEALVKGQASKPEPMVVVPEQVEAEIVVDSPPRLEAVPSEPSKASAPDEMDAALRSALETLHRMNVRTR